MRCVAVGALALLAVLAPSAARAQDADNAQGDADSAPALSNDTGSAASADADSSSSSFGALGLRGDLSSASASASASGPDQSPASDGSNDLSSSNAPKEPAAANYGKPKPPYDPTQKYAGQPQTFAHPLPALQPYAGAPMLRPRGGPSSDDAADPPPNYALPATIPKKKPPVPDADPYAPLGVDVGTLRLVPYVESDLGYDSNPGRVSSGAKGSPVLRGETGFSETSLWNSNQLNANFEAGYSDYLRDPQASRPDGSGTADLRIDATKETALDFELRGALSTQQPGAPGVSAALVGEPLVVSYGATAGATETLARTTLGLHGLIDRTQYQNGALSDGTIDPLSSENYTDYTLQGRASYQLVQGVAPFVEVDADARKDDQELDAYGYARNSEGLIGQAGSTFQISALLTGSVSAGYLARTYQDARLGPLNAPVFNSSLVWTPTPLTTVTLKTTTTVNETTVSNASGELSRNASLGVSHALMRNLTLTGLASYQVNTYPGTSILEHDYLGTVGVQYSLTRWLMLKGTFTHERFISTNPGSSYVDDVMLLGLRLQR